MYDRSTEEAIPIVIHTDASFFPSRGTSTDSITSTASTSAVTVMSLCVAVVVRYTTRLSYQDTTITSSSLRIPLSTLLKRFPSLRRSRRRLRSDQAGQYFFSDHLQKQSHSHGSQAQRRSD
jgi:hypothetical protein